MQKAYTIRTSSRNYYKLDFIAKQNKRSVNKQLELLIEELILGYEKINGEIEIKSEDK